MFRRICCNIQITPPPEVGGGFLFLLVLGAEVEGDHHGDDDHHIVGVDLTPQRQDGKDSDHHQGDQGFYLQQVCVTVTTAME